MTPQGFLAGNGLPGRWQGRSRFVILATGFGPGHHFLATWAAWRADQDRCEHLIYIAIDPQPLQAHDLKRAHAHHAAIQGEPSGTDLPEPLPERLLQAWPVLTPGLHTLAFDEPTLGLQAHVTLLLALGEVADVLPTLMASVDAFFLQGLSPTENPAMQDANWLSRLNRLAAPEATAATRGKTRSVRDALTQAGFVMQAADDGTEDLDSQCDWLWGHYAPRHHPLQPPGGLGPSTPTGHAVVVGAGLAGCAAAWALCQQGWQVTLLDQHAEPAQEASGNPGGLFHSVLHGEDGVHARAHRAAALQTSRLVKPWLYTGRVQGQCDGLIRLDNKLSDEQAQALLDKLALPTEHVQWLNQDQASSLSGAALPSGGWLFGQGGWLCPADYARALRGEALRTGRLSWRPNARVHRLVRPSAHEAPHMDHADHGHHSHWRALDEQGALLADSPVVVMANAQAALHLIDTLPPDWPAAAPPMSRVRGQISWVPASALPEPLSLNLPVAGGGYALRLPNGDLLCGATSHHHDPDPLVRLADHGHNLQQAVQLGVVSSATAAALTLGLPGRVGWRATTPDRLPLVGALPLPLAALQVQPKALRLDQPRLIPRQRDAQGGLYILSGLGSRGITWAALAGQLLAHWVTGSPCPVEVDLRDAMDPARWLSRQTAKTRPSGPSPS